MAQSGTLTGNFNVYGQLVIAISGVTQGSNSPSFSLHGFPYTSGTVQGTFGGATGQWQGSNDGGTTWYNIGSSFTAAAGGTLTPSNEPFDLYQLLVTGGDGTTSLGASVRASRSG